MNNFPKPKKKTEFRVVGPIIINGLNVWRVFQVGTFKQMGPDCFSIEEVKKRIDDVVTGKKVFWFGNQSFVKKSIK